MPACLRPPSDTGRRPPPSGSPSARARESRSQPWASASTTGAGPPPAEPHGRIRAHVGPDPLDLQHQGASRVIGAYLLDTPDGPALFDCGPASCAPRLKEALRERGIDLRDLRHLLLSHIPLDHAGAAGVLVREHPGLRVHVSEIGAPHLADPSRLEASARPLYGDAFDTLWGELAPVPEQNIQVVGETVLGLECFPTAGHATHHVCYL